MGIFASFHKETFSVRLAVLTVAYIHDQIESRLLLPSACID